MPASIGIINSTNNNGDPCDSYFNIFLDPQFDSPTTGDFSLLISSPCIDAGDPRNPTDPDGSIADMGALPHVPAPTIGTSSYQLMFGGVQVSQHAELPLAIYNWGDATLVIYDVYTSEPNFSTNYDPADSLIESGDSLAIMVSFDPLEVTVYIENLTIENNDQLVQVGLLGIGEQPPGVQPEPWLDIPEGYALRPPYPNPFNPSTTLLLELPEANQVMLSVYDASGNQVVALVNSWLNAGHHEIVFDGSDLASGVYIYRMQAGLGNPAAAGGITASGKMILLK